MISDMQRSISRSGGLYRALACLASAVALAVAGGCASGGAPAAEPASPADADLTVEPAAEPSAEMMRRAARADSVRQYYNQADVDFMTGMIGHHAQALVMARMAPEQASSEAIKTLAARIINAQRDEIELMQRWLRERDEPVPHVGEGGETEMLGEHGGHRGHHGDEPMAGMLTPVQMQKLREARGEQWDRLFLTYMIQHHKGALVMVDELFSSPGAGQGDAIFKIASDIGADQASEIDRMQRMLEALVFNPR